MKEKDVEKAKNKLPKHQKTAIDNFLPTTEEHSGRRDEQRRAQRPAAE